MIHGEFDPADSYPKPWVRALVYLQGISQQWEQVRLLIDTGAARTCLHPADALAVGVPRRSLLRRQAWADPPIMVRGVGGSTEYYPASASLAFETVDGNLYAVDRQILVAKATPTNTRLPSLLGWDVLRDFHLSIRHDTGIVGLEPLNTDNIVQVPQAPSP